MDGFRWPPGLNQEKYYDKLLGALVGSAIGDAMGAPFEMRDRRDIVKRVGYINRLYPLQREASPEGPWQNNLPAGGTTDDTRWKSLVGEWLFSLGVHQDQLDAGAFAEMILRQYDQYQQEGNGSTATPPNPKNIDLRLDWLYEWTKVARAYLAGDLDAYSYALNRFYGGDLACGGMLYAPMIGLYYPVDPQRAYLEAYRISIFDLGYARDITGLTAAGVAAAMQPGITFEQILSTAGYPDPLRYTDARLVGRITERIRQDAQAIVQQVKSLRREEVPNVLEVPANFPYDRYYFAQLQMAYELLDAKLQDIAFHAGEIHLIHLTALYFGEGNFERTLEFVVNYGRDNDTVAAVTGAILGAYLGYGAIPKDIVTSTLMVNEELLGISLKQLARDMSASMSGDL